MPNNITTTIDETQLPTDISTPNEFVSYANSFILMPMLGPIMINKRIKNITLSIYYLNKFVEVMGKLFEQAIKSRQNGINVRTDLGVAVDDTTLSRVAELRRTARFGASAAVSHMVQPLAVDTSVRLVSSAPTTATATATTPTSSMMTAPRNLQQIISMLARGNPIFDMAFDVDKIIESGVLLKKSDVAAYAQQKTSLQKYVFMLSRFIKPSSVTRTQINSNLALLKKGADRAKLFGPTTPRTMLNGGSTAINKSSQLLIAGFLFDVLDFDFDLYGKKDLASADATPEETEWALIRKDKITVSIKEKLLRGPIETLSVSPNATNESYTSFESVVSSQSENENTSSSSKLTRQSRSIADNIAASTTNSVESGARTQSSFNNNSVIRNSMTERLSSVSREELKVMSQMNRMASLSSYEERLSKSNMYKTEGVDDNLANTEVLFESFAKTTVTSTLDDIGLVWCPRMYSPYMNINRQINRAARQARHDYKKINYIVDPAEPALLYDTKEVYFEISASGRYDKSEYTQEVTIPFNLASENWELDDDHVVTGFRNGTSDDYDWNERNNWDDLETSSTTLLDLSRIGNTVKVSVRLETTNPERYNKGFITVSLGFRQLSAESKSALSVYEQQKKTSQLERRSVGVRARQLESLKKQELISSTNKSSSEVKKILIYNLLRQVSIDNERRNISLYYEALKSCLDWEGVYVENEMSSNPPYPLYPHDHFVNANAARLFLPVRKEKETDFVNLMKEFSTSVYASKIDSIVTTVNQRRTEIKNMTKPPVLFKYDDEIVLGVHRENVFSNTNFKFV